MGQVSEKSFPFDAEEVNGNWDREYKAEDFARYFKAFISSGSFLKVASNLQVLANGDMSVTIKPGDMMIEGYRYENTEDIIVNLTAADGTLSRIDRISITWSSADRDIHCTVQEGEFSLNPVAPVCRRNADYKDYVIADVFVAAGVVSILQTDITDQRLNDEVCGLAAPFVELDTQELYAKLEAFYEEVVVESEQWHQSQEQSFDVWFKTIKGQLSGDVAGNLQLKVSDLEDRALLLEDTLGYSCKNLLKNTVAETYGGNTLVVNGITFTSNNDGSVTVNGTATANSTCVLSGSGTRLGLKNGRYILSGCPSGGSHTTYKLQFWNADGSTAVKAELGNGLEIDFTNENGNYNIAIAIMAGTVANNLTFYPMLRKAEIEDSTYEPYHETVDARLVALEAGGGADKSTVRYISDEADENFDWVQVQNADGSWINFQRAYTQRYELYVDNNDGGEFESHAIWKNSAGTDPTVLLAPTLVKEATLNASLIAPSNAGRLGYVLSKKIDLSRFKTLAFNFTAKSNNNNDVIYIDFIIVQTLEKVSPPILENSIFKAYRDSRELYGEESIDISSLNGEYYVGFALATNLGATVSIEVSDFYME